MTLSVIVDTGPLVALLVKSDAYHEWAKHQFGLLKHSAVTCEPVIAEVAHLVRRAGGPLDFIFKALRSGWLRCPFRLQEEIPAIESLVKRYADLPMSLADACLVRMAELFPESRVMTLDSDFSIYRINGRRAIPLLRPEDC